MCGGPTVFNLCLQPVLTLLAELTVSCAALHLLASDLRHLCFIPIPPDSSLVRGAQRGGGYLCNQPMYGATPTV